MQELNANRIEELELIVKQEFAEVIEDKENVLESVDRVEVFGVFGTNVSRFRFLPGHKIMMEKLATEVQNHDLEHYNMPSDFKVPRTNVSRSPIGYLYGKKTRVSLLQQSVMLSNPIQANAVPHISIENNAMDTVSEECNMTSELVNMTKVDTKSQLLLKINSLFEPFDVTTTEDKIVFVKDETKVPPKVTAHIDCEVCSKNKRKKNLTVQYTASKRSCKRYWNLSNFVLHLNTKHERTVTKLGDSLDENPEKSEVDGPSKQLDNSLDEKPLKSEPNDSIELKSRSSTPLNVCSAQPSDKHSNDIEFEYENDSNTS